MLKLFRDRNFASLIFSQSLGALNDNALRQTYLLLAVQLAGKENQAAAVAFVALPFIFFSPLAGQLVDRHSKRKVILFTKAAELVAMSLAAVAVLFQNLPLVLLSIFLMFSQSAFFSPAKYGILPEILDYEQLSEGNGILQMTTYLAILFGVAVAGLLLELAPNFVLAVFFLAVSASGFLVAFLIDPLEPADPGLQVNFNPFSRVADSLSWIRRDRVLFVLVVGFGYAWLAGTVLTLVINVYGIKVLGLGETFTSLLFVALALGIGAGSLLAGRWSEKKIELGLIPLGALGLGVSQFFLSLVSESVVAAYSWMFVSGVFSALFLIPFQASLQERPPEEKKGDLLATANIFTFTGVIMAAASYVLLVRLAGRGPRFLLFLVGFATILACLGLIVVLPRLLSRFVLWIYAHLFYRVEVKGREKIPRREPALLVAESKFPPLPLLIGYAVSRPLKFIVPARLLETSSRGWIYRLLGAVTAGSREEVEGEAVSTLKDGGIVCCRIDRTFPTEEKLGEITRRREVELIEVSLQAHEPGFGAFPSLRSQVTVSFD